MLPKRPTVYLRSLLIASAIFGSIVSESSQLCAQTDTSGKKDSIFHTPPAQSKGGLDKPIDYDATDSIIFDIRRNMVYLYRDAHIKYDQIDLTAYFISVDLTKKEIFATGGFDSNGNYSFIPVFKDGDAVYVLDSMRYNSNSKKGRVYGLQLKEDEFYIHLHKVLKQEDGSFVGESGRITTCNLPHPHFYFNTQKIKVIPNKKVFFGPANMVIEDVPTPLAVPFGLAPIKKGRISGLLPPYPGYNANNGTFFLQNLGYYTGLGPYADLTLSTDAYFNGDLRVGATTNFVKLYKFRGSVAVNVSWFGNGAEITSPTFARKRDFGIRSNFGFDNKFLPGTTLSGNINVQTGNYNKLNSRSLNSFSQNQFNSSISYGRSFLHNRLNLTAAARHSQNTSDRSFNLELPSLTLSVPGINPFGKINNAPGILKQLRVSYSANYNNILNTKDSLLFSDSGLNEFKKIQTSVGHNLPIVTNFKLFKGILNFSPSFSYNEAWFFKTRLLSMNDSGDIISRDSSGFYRVKRWGVSTGMSTNIYGTYRDLKWGKVRALRHTITPTLTVGYNPKISMENLGLSRSYTDTAGDIVKYNIVNASDQLESGYMGFGISNNLQAKKVTSLDTNGKEELEKINLIDGFRINSSYNFLADSFNWADVTLNFNTSLLKIFNIHMDAAFSPYGIDENKRYVKEYAWKYNREPLHFESFGTQFTTSFKPETFKKKKPKPAQKEVHEEDAEIQRIQKNPDDYIDFKIPWSVNLTYNYAYNNNALFRKDRSSQHNIQVRGDFSITPEWKVGYNVGMDLKRKEFTSPEFRLSRDLHCWQLEFRWVPNGPFKQWQFTLHPKSGVLSDLKINRIITSNPAYIGG